jgi:hypothetical protein
LDFEKAFDSLDWSFLQKVLQAFNFGDSFCRWIEVFYKDIKTLVSVNGQMSSWFPIQRGCRQGDPLSPYLFILAVEILGIMIRENENIKGICINDREHKISQYADDTEVLLEGDQKSFEETIANVNNFGKKSGLFLNAGKTSAIWLGSKKNSAVRYMQHLLMEWNPERFKILGIWFTNNLKEMENINFHDKFTEVKILYKVWLKRQITPLGRVAILKSLILSKLVHLWILLPNPPNDTIDMLQNLVFKFVWNEKNDRINRKTVILGISEGGLGVPDIKSFILSLKLTWLRKFSKSNHSWKNVISELFPKIKLLEKLGAQFPIYEHTINTFWFDVFQSYKIFSGKIVINVEKDFLAEPIFFNGNITIGGKVFFYKKWYDAGIFYIKHVLDTNGKFLSFNLFTTKFQTNTDFISYTGCIQSIKAYARRNEIIIENAQTRDTCIPKVWNTILCIPKGASIYYSILTRINTVSKFCTKWNEKIGRVLNWKLVFKKVKSIKEVKLKWFQIRIVHRIIATNIVLAQMNVVADDTCSFCKNVRESIVHLFWHCEHVKLFWMSLEQILIEKCKNITTISFNESLILFGHDDMFKLDEVFDLILLLAKFFIYKCRFEQKVPQLNPFLKYLKHRYRTEKYIACINLNYNKFHNNWMFYKPLLE